jgi:uncharacterized protein
LILVDANLLIYAHAVSMPQHRAARTWLDAQLSGHARVALPWPNLLAFLRIVTNPRLFDRAETMLDAWSQVEEWLACDNVWQPEPGDRHPELLRRMLAVPGTRSKLVPDAHLAALAIEHGLTLCTSDGDFARFPDLRWVNPLAG